MTLKALLSPYHQRYLQISRKDLDQILDQDFGQVLGQDLGQVVGKDFDQIFGQDLVAAAMNVVVSAVLFDQNLDQKLDQTLIQIWAKTSRFWAGISPGGQDWPKQARKVG